MNAALASRCVAAAVVLSFSAAAAMAAQTVTVPPELWDRPRTGEAILQEPVVRQAVDAYLAHDGERLIIHYGPGQDAHLDAQELRSWLIALAVEADHITLRRDLKHREELKIEVTP